MTDSLDFDRGKDMFLAAVSNSDALDILTASWNLTQSTYSSWREVWQEQIFDYRTSGLWRSLVQVGINLAGISVIYLALTEGKEVIHKRDWSQLLAMFVWPLVMGISFLNNGQILASGVQFVTVVGNNQVQMVTQAQMFQYPLGGSLKVMGASLAAREQIDSTISECAGKVEESLQACLKKNLPRIKDILNAAKSLAKTLINTSVPLPGLEKYVDAIVGAAENTASVAVEVGEKIGTGKSPGQAINDGFSKLIGVANRNIALPIIKFFLICCQWAFVNTLEAARLLTALSAPIAMGLSLLPLQGRPIIVWLVGYLSLIGLQLGYNILVGLVASVVLRSQLEAISDVAFLFFLSIFAPGLSGRVAVGAGKAIYSAIVSNTKALAEAISAGISTLASAVSKFV